MKISSPPSVRMKGSIRKGIGVENAYEESKPRSASKMEALIFKSEKIIELAALFFSFWSIPE